MLHLIESAEDSAHLESQLQWRIVTFCSGSYVAQALDPIGQHDTNSQYRFIELNSKHLLGRAPRKPSEIGRSIQRFYFVVGGYEAEILSYIDSDGIRLSLRGKILAPLTPAPDSAS